MSTAAGAPDLSPLFQPFRLRSLVIDNRFVMSPMTREHAAGGVPGAEVVGYYARRVAGGTGLIAPRAWALTTRTRWTPTASRACTAQTRGPAGAR
jgi:2,4-dienoyl-CoA reductase-like NADH-dependent reductase (Old Yellow Enzyme family)